MQHNKIKGDQIIPPLLEVRIKFLIPKMSFIDLRTLPYRPQCCGVLKINNTCLSLTTLHSQSPLTPLTNISPRSSRTKPQSVRILRVASGTWMRPLTPVLSMRLAKFTVEPQISYCGLVAPITPAATGPWAMPAWVQTQTIISDICYNTRNRACVLLRGCGRAASYPHAAESVE